MSDEQRPNLDGDATRRVLPRDSAAAPRWQQFTLLDVLILTASVGVAAASVGRDDAQLLLTLLPTLAGGVALASFIVMPLQYVRGRPTFPSVAELMWLIQGCGFLAWLMTTRLDIGNTTYDATFSLVAMFIAMIQPALFGLGTVELIRYWSSPAAEKAWTRLAGVICGLLGPGICCLSLPF